MANYVFLKFEGHKITLSCTTTLQHTSATKFSSMLVQLSVSYSENKAKDTRRPLQSPIIHRMPPTHPSIMIMTIPYTAKD